MQNLLPAFYKTIDIVCDDWKEFHSTKWGFSIDASRKSISRANYFAVDLLSNNSALPSDPGPFKAAAAFLISGMYFFKFQFLPIKRGATIPSEDEKAAWKARILFKSIPIFLLQLKLANTGKQLQKHWDAPSLHYRLDFLNFIRWCQSQLPVVTAPTPTPQASKPVAEMVDIVRVVRLVMAMTLIIESCYYLTDAVLKCDVIDKVQIKPNETEQIDLIFDCKD